MNKHNAKFYYWILGVMLAVALVLRVYNHYLPGEVSQGASLLGYQTASVSVGNANFHTYLASTAAELSSGLSNIEELPLGDGMLFIFKNQGKHSFWMKDMNFDLDFVWLRDGKVVELMADVSSAPLNRLKTFSSEQPVDFVLELNAGEIAGHSLKIGDEFSVKY